MSSLDDKSRDENERRRLESLGAMTPGFVHEFNNLLNIIVGNLGLIAERIDGDELLGQCIEDVQDASMRATRLCQLVQSQASGHAGEVSAVDLNALVKECATLVETAFLKGVKFDLQAAPDLPETVVVGPVLRQVLTTILLNAASSVANQEVTIKIRTALAGVEDKNAAGVGEPLRSCDGAVLLVEATANADELDRAASSERESGHIPGLALSAARDMARSLGGDLLWVESPGQGRALRLLIPGHRMADVQAARSQVSADGELSFSGLVLVVDDEKASRKVISTILERVGSTVLTAASGEEALSIYEEHAGQVALVLLDMSMPGMGGNETFRRLFALDEQVKVLIMSGYDEKDGLDGLKSDEVLGYLQKPFRLQALTDKLIEILPAIS